ncbi:lethal(2) giant larvae protein homolog 1-like isoform X2 [Homarus americanus]|uniref:lethal(2) giant larvae protein homolog 1-like isoform X2 n=1 Tax=Homarus americanus TaxID=6706 RepID=UPI001C455F14|nr:lethal(2) giant larvae protein homolog 1-like isoform X2 [Homarus americanus]
MLKFMKHQQKISPERIQKQKELFAFNKACYHGFPAKPSALAWDPLLRLLAIATKNGQIRIYGTPGVELYGQDENSESAITHLIFLQGQCRLVSLCEDNSLHLWQLKQLDDSGSMQLTQANSTSLEGKLKKISVVVADSKCEHLMVGTEGGNIYLLNLSTFAMSDNIIYQDVVMQNVPEDYKVNPGPVEAIAEHPTEPNKILIGYQRGLIVLWDKKNLCADQTYVCSQQLESVCWHSDASHFTTSHNDGSYMVWSATESAQPTDGPHTVYGPFPCKPITKILRPTGKDEDFIVFSGGMPRASYGDRNTVTVILGDYHVTFNLTSKVIDFVLVKDSETGHASCLAILAEEEAVFIDLETEEWPAFAAPYLASLHSSAITCSVLASSVAEDVFDKIKEAGSKQQTGLSTRPWPINGGKIKNTDEPKQRDVLLTGHEDGTVQFWDASGVSLTLLYKIQTSQLFVSEDLGGDGASAEDDDWPPFRKAGLFDPYSDDPRLGVKKMEICPYTGTLIVAGTAGQVLVLNLTMEEKEIVPECVKVNVVAENDNFVWKSHNKLDMKTEAVKFDPGMQPTVVVQFFPPASCTSLNLHSEWGLIACGTAHGFALFDIIQKKNLLAKSTLSPLDIANAADEGPMSRRKSLKKSLRESFRRLRRGRSQRKTGRPGPTSPTSTHPQSTGGGGGAAAAVDDEGVKPVERAVEARSHASDYIGSMVRCLHLTKCFIANTQLMSATLWAGTNSGAIFVFTISIPPSEKRGEVPLSVQLGKEIHLKHGAPVISVCILDGASRPFPEPMAVKKEAAPSPNSSLPHRVLICSEEQFKVFTLPQLKPFCKFKLTAHEGSRVRKIGYSDFLSSVDESYREPCFVVMTNMGDYSVYSLPDCRRQMYAAHIKKEDINGINSVVFSNRGESLYLMSPCELERVSLSARHITRPTGTIPVIKPQLVKEPEEETEPSKEKSNENQAEGDDGAANAVAAATAATAAAPETQEEPVNPQEKADNGSSIAEKDEKVSGDVVGESNRKVEEVKENGDNSVLSGDITIDSIRDHMDELKVSEKSVDVASTGSTTLTSSGGGGATVKQESSSVTVVKSTTITSVSSSSQESSSVQVVETSTTEVNHSTVNGTEVKIRAPLAKAESFFSKEPRIKSDE